MANFNRVILAGNMTRDPETSYTASNTAVCKFGLAINRKWRDRNSGENREETCFVDCTAFGRTGEVINQYFGKGKPILVEGRLHYHQWEAQDGGKRSKLDVVVESFEFVGGPQSGGGGGGGGQGGGRQQSRPAPARSAAGPASGGYDDSPPNDYEPPMGGEDVPF
ncbi:MAG TPA: single-stranded DNA-binding protein [Phycisphaerae bacterium]|nr:single-stranded DNA-binding protein [Phycisphaerae bacterium]